MMILLEMPIPSINPLLVLTSFPPPLRWCSWSSTRFLAVPAVQHEHQGRRVHRQEPGWHSATAVAGQRWQSGQNIVYILTSLHQMYTYNTHTYLHSQPRVGSGPLLLVWLVETSLWSNLTCSLIGWLMVGPPVSPGCKECGWCPVRSLSYQAVAAGDGACETVAVQPGAAAGHQSGVRHHAHPWGRAVWQEHHPEVGHEHTVLLL